MSLLFCGYCDKVIDTKKENILNLIDSEYGILCIKHKKEIDLKGWID